MHMRELHWRVAHNYHVFFTVNSTVERPGFHFCEGSARTYFLSFLVQIHFLSWQSALVHSARCMQRGLTDGERKTPEEGMSATYSTC